MGNKVGGKKKLQSVMFKDAAIKFDAAELQELKIKFQTLAERSKGPTVDKATFLKIFPLRGILGERLFTLFDVDRSGVLDYEEFICGLALFCRGSQEEKLRVMFDMYDLAGDGAIHKKELSILLSHMPKETLEHSILANKIRSVSLDESDGEDGNGKSQTNDTKNSTSKGMDIGSIHGVEIELLVEQAFKDCDLNHDGKLSFDQFNIWVNQNPDLAGWLESEMNEEIFEAAGVLSGSKKTMSNQPRLGSDSPKSPKSKHSLSWDQKDLRWGLKCLYCVNEISFCFSCGEEFTEDTLHVYMDPTTEPVVTDDSSTIASTIDSNTTATSEDTKNQSGNNTVPSGNSNTSDIKGGKETKPYWKITCIKCDDKIAIYFCGGCGKKVTKSTFSKEAVFTDTFESLPSSSIDSTRSVESGRSFFAYARSNSYSKVPIKFTDVTMSGMLMKVGGRFGAWKRRFYWIDGKFCYYTKNSGNMTKPDGAIYLAGAYVSPLDKNKNDAAKSKFFGIEIMTSTGGERDVRQLYATTKRDQEFWISALRKASDTKSIDLEYEILQQIGIGRFSKVYRCKKKNGSNEEYAVKIMQKESMNAKELELLRMEIAVMKLMTHPNVITLEDIYESKSKIHIVMELVRGGELFQHIVGRKRFSEMEAFKLIRPIADALKYIHSLGIVHRDLKPENILCEKGLKNIRIADFGLSQLVAPTHQLKLACGTLSYVAPEVLNSQGYGSPADIWSLGVIAFLVVRGKLPYTAKTQEETVENIKACKNVIGLDDKYWKRCSLECCDIVSRMLDKDPLTRITAAEILNHEWTQKLSKEEKAYDKQEAESSSKN
eukprot:g1807.t1